MIRFTMPDPALDRSARIKDLTAQFDAFLASEAMRKLLELMDTDIEGLSCKYDARRKHDGGVRETQELSPCYSLEEKRKALYPCFKELGFFDIDRPKSPSYSRLLIMGASLHSTYLKTACSAAWITPQVLSVDGLACFRPLNPVERSASVFQTSSDTEFGAASDAIVSVFDLDRDKWQDRFTGDRNLNRISCIRTYPEEKDGCTFRVFAAPSTAPSERRADTGDTLRFYLEHGGIRAGETLLAITGNRYCNRQFVQLAYQILHTDSPVGLDVVGNYRGKEITTEEEYDPVQYLQIVIALADWIGRFKKDFSE